MDTAALTGADAVQKHIVHRKMYVQILYIYSFIWELTSFLLQLKANRINAELCIRKLQANPLGHSNKVDGTTSWPYIFNAKGNITPLPCWTPQTACVPVTISHISPSHSSTHHSLWCTSCTKQPQELSTWQESCLLWVCSSSLHPCHGTCQSQQAVHNKGQQIALPT